MISELIDSAVSKLKTKKDLDIFESLAISLFTVGETKIGFSGDELSEMLQDSIAYNKFRNTNTILSTTENFLVGELYKVKMLNKEVEKEISILLNIELIALKASSNVEGMNPVEILLSLPNPDIIDILNNSFNFTYLRKTPILEDVEDLENFTKSKTRIDKSSLIIKINRVYIIFSYIENSLTIYELKIVGNNSIWVQDISNKNINLTLKNYIKRDLKNNR